jgi:hypothetical protein
MQRAQMNFVLGQAPGGGIYQPGFSQQQYGLFGQNVPMGSDALDWEKDATNLVQDQIAMLSDPMTAILSGAGGFAPEAWEPTVTYEQVPRPGYDFLSRQIRKAPVTDPTTGQPVLDPNTGQPVVGPAAEQTFSGYVADEIINQGGSSTTAMAKIKTLIQGWDEQGVGQDPEHPEYAKYQMLTNSLPSMQSEFEILGQPGAKPTIDWMTAQNDAEMWEIAYHEDPKPGPASSAIYDEEGNVVSESGGGVNEVRYDDAGNQILVQRHEEPTPTMELFSEFGLPMPTDVYETSDFLGPDWAAQNEAYNAAQGEYKQMGRTIQQGGELPGGIQWPGRREMRETRRAVNQAEEDWRSAKDLYEQSIRTPAAAAGLAEATTGPELNWDLMPPEWAAKHAAQKRAAIDKALRVGEGPVNATGTVETGGRLMGIDPLRMLNTAGGIARNPAGATTAAVSRGAYTAPGATIASMLKRALGMAGTGGGEGEGEDNLTPAQRELYNEVNEKYRTYKKGKKALGQARDVYQGLQEQRTGLREQLGGARNELYGADYGHALAASMILNQQGRTPYTDALMQRRMVPMAMGVQPQAWTGY